MTDPRAALAEAMDEIDSGTGVLAESIQLLLAERGVLLVTEPQIWEAVLPFIRVKDQAAARRALAALSGEVTE